MKNRMKKVVAIAFVSVVAFSQAMSMDDPEVSAAYSCVKDAYTCINGKEVAKAMNPLQQRVSNAFSYAKDKAAAGVDYGRSQGVWLKDRALQAGSQAGSFVADKAVICKNTIASCADSAKDKALLGYYWAKVRAEDMVKSGKTLINEHPKFVAGVAVAAVAASGLGYWAYKRLQKTANKSTQTPPAVENAETQTD